MAEHNTSNVVPFGSRPGSFVGHEGASAPETSVSKLSVDAASMLPNCRDRIAHGVATVFAQHLGRANDEFLALADRAINQEEQQLCFAAMTFLANRDQPLLQRFRGAYIAAFDDGIAALTTGARPRHGLREPGELSLVDNDDFEQDLAIGKLSARAVFNCSQHLVALDRRLAALLNVHRIGQDENPLYPGKVFNAMLQALTDMEVERDLALILLQSFERHVAAELPGIYADLNRYLAQSGILPNIPQSGAQPGAQDPPPGSPYPTGEAAMGGGGPPLQAAPPRMDALDQGQVAHGAGVAGNRAPGANEDVFSQLLRAIQTANALQASHTGLPAGPPVPSGPPLDQAVQAGPPRAVNATQLIDALGDLQRGRADTRAMPGLGAVQIDPEGGNVLQQIRSTPMAHWSHPMDAMTIDIVSMLFDAIFNDPDLSASMRAEIAKLQIPVLKVALLDKNFFSDRKHPARRLLDAIATSGIGRGEHDEPRLLGKIRSIVEAVVSGFDSDIQIFSTQLQKLDAFLCDEEDRARGRATHMVDQLAQRERKEVAASRVAGEIEPRINRRQIPTLIADFLSNNWRLVLVDAFVRGGEHGEDWTEALRLMDELIWSVEPKSVIEERDRLLVLLPDMLKRLRGGLERIDLEGAWDSFFSELIRLHMAALSRQTPPDSAAAGASSTRTVEPAVTATATQPRSEASPLDETAPGSEPRPVAKEASTEAPADRHLRLVQALDAGAWIEFQSFRGTRNTLRLSWVSEFKRVYLFTNRQGENAMTLAANSLAEHLRRGTARLLSQNPLTDRAVAQVLEQINPGKPRLE